MEKKKKRLRMVYMRGADERKAWFSGVASITVFDSFQASGANNQSNFCHEPSMYT